MRGRLWLWLVLCLGTTLFLSALFWFKHWHQILFAGMQAWDRITATRHAALVSGGDDDSWWRAVSFNTFQCNWNITDSTAASRVQRLLPRLATFHLVCLQELFGAVTWRVHRVLRELTRMGLRFHALPDHPKWWSQQVVSSGLLVASVWPLEHVANVAWTRKLHVDQLACKGFQHVKVHWPVTPADQPLHVLNVHMQSEYQTVDCSAQSVICAQLAQLRTYRQQHIPADAHVLYAGDFNCTGITSALDAPAAYMARVYEQLQVPPESNVFGPEGVPTQWSQYDARGEEVSVYETQTRHATTRVGRHVDHLLLTGPNSGLGSCRPQRRSVLDWLDLSDHVAVAAEWAVPSKENGNCATYATTRSHDGGGGSGNESEQGDGGTKEAPAHREKVAPESEGREQWKQLL